jgi:hypothetical protein
MTGRRGPKDIPQDGLFGVPTDPRITGTRPVTPERPKTIRTARCPQCRLSAGVDGRVGVIRDGDLEVFREHDKFTAGGARIRCNGSGQEAPP